jgi:hypothetical protein
MPQYSEILERLLYLLFKVEDRVSIKRILDNFDKNGKTRYGFLINCKSFFS